MQDPIHRYDKIQFYGYFMNSIFKIIKYMNHKNNELDINYIVEK